jgi:hypothetical protein
MCATDLVEANVGGLLTEALTADVQAVLADETGLVGADTAVKEPMLASLPLALYCPSPQVFLRIARLFLQSYSSAAGCTHHSRLPLP